MKRNVKAGLRSSVVGAPWFWAGFHGSGAGLRGMRDAPLPVTEINIFLWKPGLQALEPGFRSSEPGP